MARKLVSREHLMTLYADACASCTPIVLKTIRKTYFPENTRRNCSFLRAMSEEDDAQSSSRAQKFRPTLPISKHTKQTATQEPRLLMHDDYRRLEPEKEPIREALRVDYSDLEYYKDDRNLHDAR